MACWISWLVRYLFGGAVCVLLMGVKILIGSVTNLGNCYLACGISVHLDLCCFGGKFMGRGLVKIVPAILLKGVLARASRFEAGGRRSLATGLKGRLEWPFLCLCRLFGLERWR